MDLDAFRKAALEKVVKPSLASVRRKRAAGWIISTQHVDLLDTDAIRRWMHALNITSTDFGRAPVVMVWDNRYREPFRMRFMRNNFMDEVVNTPEWAELKETFPSMQYNHDDWNGYVTMSDTDIVFMRFHFP